MGLDIKTYHYSYRTLHLLRQFALRYEGIDISIFDFYDQYPEVKTFEEVLVLLIIQMTEYLDHAKVKEILEGWKHTQKYLIWLNHIMS